MINYLHACCHTPKWNTNIKSCTRVIIFILNVPHSCHKSKTFNQESSLFLLKGIERYTICDVIYCWMLYMYVHNTVLFMFIFFTMLMTKKRRLLDNKY